MKDKTLRMTMLFDFFSQLLTEKQREYFDLYYNEDFSLSEIAESAGITRQGVYDLITRAEKTLEMYEAETGVVERFDKMRAGLNTALELAREMTDTPLCGRSAELAQELLETIGGLQTVI